METLELLEELLVEYQGTLLLVSHDRTFLDNVVTSTMVFEDDGIHEYVGGYDDWLRQRSQAKANKTPTVTIPSEKVNKSSGGELRERQQALRKLETKIAKLEEKQQSLQHALADPELYHGHDTKLTMLQQSLAKVETELAELILQWEQLV